ncbi:MAG TPA: prepilin-type N-terminal cleavage/methylation domain-containing protein [Oligoflexus sp.]|uniref:PulJ/GspJ family protein n=1 Tax=Oligoflexus sp. TaxID=1971216 RepID=UPI002D7EBB60|nr:prepilin-type N-terminal cleavage/methylation domain-containing protein [Oligoflexus sp.]HET9238318.1 prepilin-type N-terminal cleavage/methylation domain-containing protein [Oligoflexus sp.]
MKTKLKDSEAGMTLVEMVISIAIGSVLAFGGYQMLVRSQKYLAYKKIDQVTQTEVEQLLSIIKKDWDYRMRESQPSIPGSGQEMLNAAGASCGPGGTICPKLRLWIRRMVNGVSVIDKVTIENICQTPGTKEMVSFVSGLDYAGSFNASCHRCPRGQVPAVRITGVNNATGIALLAAENRIFPQNVANENLTKMNRDNVLGMQACFSQAAADAAMTVDVRAVIRDQSSTSLRLVKKNQVYPFENFAGIRLEQ